jgi:hypothetical protein
MHDTLKILLVCSCVTATVALSSACSPRRIPPLGVQDLMEDRVLLDGILMKCNRTPPAVHNETDCANARIAIERLAQQREPEQQARRAQDFERSREQYRQQQDKLRDVEQAKTKVDAYHLPVVPVDQPPAPKAPQDPIVGQTQP